MELKPIHKEIIRFALTTAAASLIGGYFAYQKAMATPVPAQYVVVDIAGYIRNNLQREIDPSKPSGQIAMKEMADRLKERFKDLTDAGIVVLDASQVIAAPEAAIVNPADLLAVQPKGQEGRDAAQKPSR